MLEGKDSSGYVWIRDLGYDDYYHLKDFEHLVVSKVVDYSESLPREHWEAIIFENEQCQKVIGREEFKTEREAKECIENYVEITLKNRKTS